MKVDNQNGAILVILAFILTLLMLFLALSIDTAMLGSSHQKQARTAELGALAAVETFLSTDGTDAQKLTEARQRAEEVVGFGLNRILSQTGLNQNQVVNSDGAVQATADSIAAGTNRGVLEEGQYFFQRPPECDSGGLPDHACPCGIDQQDFAECFRPAQAGEPISAFRLVLFTQEDNPAGTVFAGAGGAQESFRLSSQAISTITPRHAVFLIDMSGSMTAETHFSSPEDLSLRSKYAFRVSSDQTDGLCGRPDIFDALNDCSYPNYHSNPTSPSIGEVDDGFGAIWSFVIDRCRDSSNTQIGKHYKSDYECLGGVVGSPIEDQLIDIDDDPIYYLVETKYDSDNNPRFLANGDPYRGPEPLSSVLSAINEALQAFETVLVPGDEVSFIAYDARTPQIPNFPPGTVGFAPVGSAPRIVVRASPQDCPSDSTDPYCRLFRVTDMSDLSRATILERANMLLFPLANANTDLSEALIRAEQILVNSPLSDIADNMVISFGDGLANCIHSQTLDDGYQQGITFDFFAIEIIGDLLFGPTTTFLEDVIDPSNPNSNTPFRAEECIPTGGLIAHANAISEAHAIITGEGRPFPGPAHPNLRSYVDAGIKYHSFLFGQNVQPHTALIAGSTTGLALGQPGADTCMTEAQARDVGRAFTDCGNALLNNRNDVTSCGELASERASDATADNPFFASGYSTENFLSSPSGGRYFPIRPKCEPEYFNNLGGGISPPNLTQERCEQGEGLQTLNQLCAGSASLIGDVVRHTDSIGGINPDDGTPIPRMLDDGRLICDPLCRDQATQARDGINGLFSDSPIITVEPLEIPPTPIPPSTSTN